MRVKGAWKPRENKKDEKIRVTSGKKNREEYVTYRFLET